MADIDMQRELIRIERDRAETQKLVAESGKLLAEQHKLNAENGKLLAEQHKLSRDTSLAPWQMALTGMATGAALFAAGVALMRVLT